MANSSLATYKWPKKTDHYNIRNHKIDKITIHHMAGNLTLAACCSSVQSRGGSTNYMIDSNGKIGVMIDEQYRAWTSNSPENDHRAVTIEVANDGGEPNWHVSDKALAAVIKLCVDICKRNGIKKLNYTGNTSGNLTMHKMFYATACPGPYLGGKFPYIASEVNKQLGSSTASSAAKSTSTAKSTGFKAYIVQITYAGGVNVRKGAGVSNAKTGEIARYGFKYTIVEEKVVSGQTWGKLKSGAGWICLTGFARKV
jgi:hypothetical protein